MGIDEALLTIPGPPTLRLYEWSPPGLSLGYFQDSGDFANVEGDHVVVRRLTGGGAIYHDHEITFALTLDADWLPASIPESYRLIHDAIGKALGQLGISVHCAPNALTRARPRVPWCFEDAHTHDLVTDSGAKIVGSAQRRVQRPHPRVLHHGSLVMKAPQATPLIGEVGEHASVHTVQAAVQVEIAASLGLSPRSGELTTEESDLASALATTRYDDDAFTYRR